MLKKFLKFLKGTSPERDFNGSYLDHLLEQVRPRVQAQLEECPEHDPLLLVVAEILRLTKPDQWTEELACPLVDDMSPALSAPPPPKLADVSSEGFEIVETSEVVTDAGEGEQSAELDDDEREEEEHDGGEQADVNSSDEDEVDEEISEESEPAEDADGDDIGGESNDAAAADDVVHVDVEGLLGTAEMRPQDTSDAALIDPTPSDSLSDDDLSDSELSDGDLSDTDPSPSDPGPEDTAPEALESVGDDELDQVDSSEIEEHVEGDSFDGDEASAPVKRLDSPEVLQAGRIFLGLLIENDRLPQDMQLSIAETMLARDLLLGYFVHDGHFDDKVKELLSLVEQKFNEGAFSQARILLQLFQRDRPNQVNNDRNLFYEDMILRLGIRRRHMINNTLLAELRDASSAADLDVGLTRASAWLDENLHIRFHLFTRRSDEATRWREFAAQSRRTGADDVFLRYIPPKRWRPLHSGSQPPSERMLAHVSAATVKRYVVRQLKTCYFVLRAVGDTGLEPFLNVFFDWTQSKFGFNSVRLMPLVYRQTMSETLLIDKIFEEAFRRFFQKKAAHYLSEFDEDAILEATRATIDQIAGLDFNLIPPGDYDFGGLILDRLFELEYHEPEFAFKLHRLT